jgi:hypothetical protein
MPGQTLKDSFELRPRPPASDVIVESYAEREKVVLNGRSETVD